MFGNDLMALFGVYNLMPLEHAHMRFANLLCRHLQVMQAVADFKAGSERLAYVEIRQSLLGVSA